MDAAYITSAKTAAQIPDWEDPEVVMLGRSNCGKSSLINALLNQKSIARVSATPGRTQMINYFSLSRKKDERIIVADLPGWGYQQAGGNVHDQWDKLMGVYLQRENIRDYCVLLDVRREIAPHELDFFRELSGLGQLIVVLTKTDKLKPNPLRQAQKKLEQEFQNAQIPVLRYCSVSSLKKTGVAELRDFLFRDA